MSKNFSHLALLKLGQGATTVSLGARAAALDAQDGFERWLLFRRRLKNADEIAYYFAPARAGTSLAELAEAAGLRWTIEECFLRAKDHLGLDHCEARS